MDMFLPKKAGQDVKAAGGKLCLQTVNLPASQALMKPLDDGK